jgi:ABC-type uncharacterized transport system permease subunit
MPNEMKKTTTVSMKWREDMKTIISVFLISKVRYGIRLHMTGEQQNTAAADNLGIPASGFRPLP